MHAIYKTTVLVLVAIAELHISAASPVVKEAAPAAMAEVTEQISDEGNFNALRGEYKNTFLHSQLSISGETTNKDEYGERGDKGDRHPHPAPSPTPPSSPTSPSSPTPPTSDSGSSDSNSSSSHNETLWFLIFFSVPFCMYLYCKYRDRHGSIKVLPSANIEEELRNLRNKHNLSFNTFKFSTTLTRPQVSVTPRAQAPTPRATLLPQGEALPLHSTPHTLSSAAATACSVSSSASLSSTAQAHYVEAVVIVPQTINEE